ncbi:hypothetical protein R3W88_027162 [Solanum pinnatisectum]|uniref:Chromo domain-containing protein n=1 Tax=Solanum pinnatisectum TaxID=50273 RepID=A0AAV9LFZ9_9SOLN|nr:hypothetical protein R3W88_027162 [Solanum pinnatisectum]
MGSLACLSVSKRPLAKEIQTLESKFMQLGISERGGVLASIEVRATFIENIKAKQFENENLNELKKKTVIDKTQETTLDAEDKDLKYEEKLIAILDRDVRKLRTKEIKSMKVQWKHRPVEEATWEIERDMRDKYPQLFVDSGTTPFLP